MSLVGKTFGRRGKTFLVVSSDNPLTVHVSKNGRPTSIHAALLALNAALPGRKWLWKIESHRVVFVETNEQATSQDVKREKSAIERRVEELESVIREEIAQRNMRRERYEDMDPYGYDPYDY